MRLSASLAHSLAALVIFIFIFLFYEIVAVSDLIINSLLICEEKEREKLYPHVPWKSLLYFVVFVCSNSHECENKNTEERKKQKNPPQERWKEEG